MTEDSWKKLEASAENPVWIRTETDLAKFCGQWRLLDVIALDTEFQRVETFYPIPGLIQVADDQCCYLIDPLEINDFTALAELFADRSVVKLMHAANEDLELFLSMFGVLPTPLFDTQIGGAVLNWGFSMGLQRMLEQKLDVQLAKHETTSNWLQRPLTASQELYAALDVAYLAAVYKLQKAELEAAKRYHWAEQENEALLADSLIDDAEGFDYYRRFAQMWNLPKHKMAALRDLTAWREQTARKRDVPRNWILRNQALLQIIEKWPRNIAELSRLDEVKKRILRSDGEEILNFLRAGKESAAKEAPARIPKPLHFYWNKHLKKLKAIARGIAEEQNIAPEILLRRKELELLIRSGLNGGEYSLPKKITAWRQALLAEPLLAELKKIEQTRSEGT